MRQKLPNPNGRYKQGFFDNYRPRKYVGKFPIIYRSSLELRFMKYCELCPDILSWSSEPFPIEYKSFTGKSHKYWVDFVLTNRRGQKLLIEVKPKKQVPLTVQQVQVNPVMAKNYLKWEACKDYCRKHANHFFQVVTEDFFEKAAIKV